MFIARASRDGASSVAAGIAEERHERRVALAEIHVGQVEERVAAPDRAQQRLGRIVAREDLGIAEAQAPAPQRCVHHRVALRLVDRDALALLEQQHRDAGDVERHEVRHQPHHRALAALGQRDVALDMDQPAQALRRCVPEQAALERGCGRATGSARGRAHAGPPAAAREGRARRCAARCAGANRPARAAGGRARDRAPPGRRAAAIAGATGSRAGNVRPRWLAFDATLNRRRRHAEPASCSGGSPTGTVRAAAGSAVPSRGSRRPRIPPDPGMRAARGRRTRRRGRRSRHRPASARPRRPAAPRRSAATRRAGEGHRVGRLAEERGPDAEAVGRDLVGQQTDRSRRGAAPASSGARRRAWPAPSPAPGASRAAAISGRSQGLRAGRKSTVIGPYSPPKRSAKACAVTSKQPMCGVRKTTPASERQRGGDQRLAPASARAAGSAASLGRAHSSGSSMHEPAGLPRSPA